MGALRAGPQVRRRPRPRVPGRRGRRRREVLRRWEAVLHGLETDPMSLARQLDWVAKLQLIEAYRERHGCGWDDPPAGRARPAVPRPAPGTLALRPPGHRAPGRRGLGASGRHRAAPGHPGLVPGPVPARWPTAVVTANWDSLVFDLGTDPLRRVPMMDPLKGTAEHVGALCWTSQRLWTTLRGRAALDRLSS